jgi:glycosyltransferase involved in cell wall biosynthesis
MSTINKNGIPKVTVCVVTYNQEQYIAQCLQSIVDQVTDFEFEVIVGDDCSTDKTRDIIKDFVTKYPNIVLISRENNIGAYKNFIETHNSAQGEYVCHCDGDDRWLPGKLQVQADFLDKNYDFTVVWARCNIFNDKGGFLKGELCDYSMFEGGVISFEHSLRLGSVAIHSSVMYRSSARQTRVSQGDLIDLYYTWEFLSQGNGMLLNEVFVEYRVESKGAITRNSGSLIKKLYASHALYFYKLHPEQRRNIFIFALFNCMVDFKNGRSSMGHFFLLAIRTFSLVSPLSFISHIKEAKKLIIPNLSNAK